MKRVKSILSRKIKQNFKVGLKGSVTVEMSYILPSILLMFLLIIYTVFYFHDKNILNGAAGETAALGAQTERGPSGRDVDLERVFKERVSKKLILLRLNGIDVEIEREQVTVRAAAAKSWMRVKAVQRARIPFPEKKIREKRRLESVLGQEE